LSDSLLSNIHPHTQPHMYTASHMPHAQPHSHKEPPLTPPAYRHEKCCPKTTGTHTHTNTHMSGKHNSSTTTNHNPKGQASPPSSHILLFPRLYIKAARGAQDVRKHRCV
jgi:hypothetical protein